MSTSSTRWTIDTYGTVPYLVDAYVKRLNARDARILREKQARNKDLRKTNQSDDVSDSQ